MKARVLVVLLSLSASPTAVAAPVARMQWLDVGLAVAAIVLVLAGVWLFLRHRVRAARPRGPLELIQEMDLGARERLLLVRVSDEYLLLGATSQRITLLRRLEQPPLLADPNDRPREPTL